MYLRLPEPASLSDLAADRLREAIVVGHFKPGERLIETKISASLGVSRGPLREALRVLASDGLIQIRQNRGAYVVSPSGEELESMVLARAVTEGTAARLVTASRDPDTLERLKAILAEQTGASTRRNHRELVHLHWDFHRTICAGAKNYFLLDLWKRVSNVIRIYSTGAIYKTAVENNQVFLDYFTHKSPAEAEEILRSQIIAMSYIYLRKPIPPAIRGYVTVFIDDASTVHDVRNFDDVQITRLVSNSAFDSSAPSDQSRSIANLKQ
jgi:DNA-binding GntR family transcriptional regulator